MKSTNKIKNKPNPANIETTNKNILIKKVNNKEEKQ